MQLNEWDKKVKNLESELRKKLVKGQPLPPVDAIQHEIMIRQEQMQAEKLQLDQRLNALVSMPIMSDFLSSDKKSFIHWVKILVEKIGTYLELYHDSWYKLIWTRLIHIRASGLEANTPKPSGRHWLPPISTIRNYQNKMRYWTEQVKQGLKALDEEQETLSRYYDFLILIKSNRDAHASVALKNSLYLEEECYKRISPPKHTKDKLFDLPDIQIQYDNFSHLQEDLMPAFENQSQNPSAIQHFDSMNLDQALNFYENKHV